MLVELKGKKVVIIGLARTGRAAARFCLAAGARTFLADRREDAAEPGEDAELRALGARIHFGEHDLSLLDGADYVILSPGIPPTAPIVKAAIARGQRPISEIELAFLVAGRPVIAVTGTNGKTTTTALLGHMFAAAGLGPEVCGNIGRPMISAVALPSTGPVIVEVSSFQLAFVDNFRPDIAILLNITRDHLDWHGNLSDYQAAKLRLFERQRKEDWAIVPVEFLAVIGGKGRQVALGGRPGIYIERNALAYDFQGESSVLVPISEIRLKGSHNLQNAMAAAAAAIAWGVSPAVIARALRDFGGVEHRLEYVAEKDGVVFYNDSKATNPEATVQAVRAFSEPIILMAGGKNKGNAFDDLAKAAAGRVRKAIVFGEAAADLEAAFERQGIATRSAPSMRVALAEAFRGASPGEIVLLSPACASFDMFIDFEDRGGQFKHMVKELVK